MPRTLIDMQQPNTARSKVIEPGYTPAFKLGVARRCVACIGAVARWIAAAARGLCVTVLMGSLQAYKLAISPLLGSRCRFHPSCSTYAQGSIERFGPIVGSWLAVKRLLRCGPWHPGGIDLVPECSHHSSESSSLTSLKSS